MRKECDFSKGELIIPPKAKDPNKTQICIRIDTKTLNWFRQRVHEAGGGNYQTMINDALNEYISRQNIQKEIMCTGLIGTKGVSGNTTASVSGTFASFTGWVLTGSRSEVLAHGVYKSKLMVKKEEDERKRYSFAA